MSDLQLTPASAWRRDVENVKLPSGNVARLRRSNMLSIIRNSENVPNFLAAKVTENLSGKRRAKNVPDAPMSVKDAIDSVFFLAMAAFDYPQVVDRDPVTEDEVSIAHLSEDDIAFAASYATGDATAIEAVATFRNQAQANVESVPASEDLVATT
jgi:hypothetical protein